ncbi:hypothetical protein MATR_35200 [Marivirga tractuosa]|uniref:O-antigen polymerase n=2 Tax=Marivirga TaxID=869806 RepID=E4TQB1_MARTH|nr:O-antigen polymerase [Marivirga tractuosa DSM 4126]BDD16695.1 hypothetical protein MATR_35200 [Marivirga tractuosa]
MVVLLIVLSIMSIIFKKRSITRKKLRKDFFSSFSLFYVVVVLSLIVNSTIVWDAQLETKAALFFMWFTFIPLNNSNKEFILYKINQIFSHVIFLVCLLFLSSSLYFYFLESGNDYWLHRDLITIFIGRIHPGYLSLYIVHVIFFQLIVRKNYTYIILMVPLLMLKSKTVILSIVVLLILLVVIRGPKMTKANILVIALFLILVSSFIFFNERFLSFDYISGKIYQWHTALVIFLDNPILGVGIHEISSEIILSYEKIGYGAGIQFGYNSHNLFLHILSVTGILGFITFLIPFIRSYKSNRSKFSKKSPMHMFIFSIVLNFFIFSFFENLLSAQKGVLYFSLMINICLSLDLKRIDNASNPS